MSFFWIAGRQPCMVTADLKCIAIFETSTHVPVYAPPEIRGSDVLVTGWERDPVRLAIVDSGCSSDTHPVDLVLRKFPKKIRNLIKPIQFDTAA